MNYTLVFGSPRSGTTFLQSILDSFYSVEARIGQAVPVATLHTVNQKISEEVYQALAVSIKKNIDVYLSRRYNSRFLALEDWWRAPGQLERLKDVIRRGRRPLPKWFIYKEPFLCLCPEFIWDALPGAKMIYIYRDGRDVANSLVSTYDVLSDKSLTHLRSTEMRYGRQYDHRYVPWWVEENKDDDFISASQYVRCIWMWAYMVKRCESFFTSISKKKSKLVLKIKYEHFMRNPEIWGQRICNHLDLSPTRVLQRRLGKARMTSIGKYQKRCNAEVQSAEHVAKSELEMYGYL